MYLLNYTVKIKKKLKPKLGFWGFYKFFFNFFKRRCLRPNSTAVFPAWLGHVWYESSYLYTAYLYDQPVARVVLLLLDPEYRILTHFYKKAFVVPSCMKKRSFKKLKIRASVRSLWIISRLASEIPRSNYIIENERVPIQLAQCWFPGLAISNAKI